LLPSQKASPIQKGLELLEVDDGEAEESVVSVKRMNEW
jgi:hypothetical protein